VKQASSFGKNQLDPK